MSQSAANKWTRLIAGSLLHALGAALIAAAVLQLVARILFDVHIELLPRDVAQNKFIGLFMVLLGGVLWYAGRQIIAGRPLYSGRWRD